MDRCRTCHGKIKDSLAACALRYEGRFVVVENVPAWVCEQCGETYYDPKVVEQIQELIWSNATPTRFIETPVYDLKSA